MSALTIAMLGGLGAMLGWGVADFFAKVSIDSIGELPSLVWGHVAGTSLLGAALLVDALTGDGVKSGTFSASALLGVAFFGCLQAAVYYLLYKGFGAGQVAVLSPTFASFSGLVALVSILFLDERASVIKVAALAVVFAGVFLLSTAPRESELRFFGAPGFTAVFVAMLLATLWTLGWGQFIEGRSPLPLTFSMYAAMTVALAIVARSQRVSLVGLERSAVLPLAVIGLGEAGAYAALSWAYSRTSLISVVALLSGAFSLPTILLARTFLNERLRLAAALGAVAVLGGTGLLALAS